MASFITAGTLNANIIKTGRIAGQAKPNVYFDLDSGELRASAIISDDGSARADIGTSTTSLGTTTGIELRIGSTLVGIIHSNGRGGLLIEDSTRAFGILFGPDSINISAAGSSLTAIPTVGVGIGKDGRIDIVSSPVGKAQASMKIYEGKVEVTSGTLWVNGMSLYDYIQSVV